MADTLDILTLPEAYAATNNPAASGHDDQLAQWITAVSRRVDQACGPVVQRTISDELHDGGKRRVRLDWDHVDSITTLTEYAHTTSTVLTEETNATKPAAGYLLDVVGGVSFVYRRASGADSTFPSGRKNVQVTYEAGRYANTASVDPLFKEAVSAILRRLWSRDAGAWARGGDPFDTGTQAFFDAFRQSMKEYLADEQRTPAVA